MWESYFLQEGSCDLPGAVLTPEAAPAGDVARIVPSQHGVLCRQAGHLDGVTQLHGFSQLDEGDVVAGIRSGGLTEQEVLAPPAKAKRPSCELGDGGPPWTS